MGGSGDFRGMEPSVAFNPPRRCMQIRHCPPLEPFQMLTEPDDAEESEQSLIMIPDRGTSYGVIPVISV